MRLSVTKVFLAALVLCAPGCGGGGGASAPAGDAVPPTVAITSPAGGATVTGTTTVSASATDNAGVSRVEFYLNGALEGTASTAPYRFSWDTAALPKGSYTLSARAYDAAGNVGQSAGVAVNVPLSVSVSTVVTGATAVGTVFLHGLAAPDAFGLDLRAVSLPAGAAIASFTPAGGASGALALPISPDGVTLKLAGTSGFGSGAVMTVQFVNVPAGAAASDFGVSLVQLVDGFGASIPLL